ncbi:rhodanese-like domain-containing protein [Bacillus hwajinpoensis]|uniref:Rhodanese-like domain-containing protein n=1 Tax=Guptibacillus hwajinpoensis TaxID=208199 RepID=A0A845ENB9_9BACL|nr:MULTISPECIES: rhodanese-like domain-containing protein [Pseudalkalibacillus]MYL61871.1 rhodanese-like domain-containing protein [Pseudalkalibacillus hwajinpoensis]
MSGYVKDVTPTEVNELLKSNKTISIVDVRGPEEVAEGKIPGAYNLPVNELQDRMNELDKDREHIIVCRSGGRSSMASMVLKSNGYSVLNMTGGMLEWTGETE